MINENNLKKKAKELRKEVLDLAFKRKEGHIGGGFSIIEIMVSLYDVVLTDIDKFILSKGHACLPLFILLRQKGYNPKVSGHPEIDVDNGINCTSGSLGHGFPIGIGMALARKKLNKKGKIYVLMSDGECQEGTTWESLLLGSHYKLNNIVVIIDRNMLQTLGNTEDILALGDLKSKFESFNWDVTEINGHDYNQIICAMNKNTNKPHIIIANTVKGKGISFMENSSGWHTMIPNENELRLAYEELK